jgi:hypothetical protein
MQISSDITLFKDRGSITLPPQKKELQNVAKVVVVPSRAITDKKSNRLNIFYFWW